MENTSHSCIGQGEKSLDKRDHKHKSTSFQSERHSVSRTLFKMDRLFKAAERHFSHEGVTVMSRKIRGPERGKTAKSAEVRTFTI